MNERHVDLKSDKHTTFLARQGDLWDLSVVRRLSKVFLAAGYSMMTTAQISLVPVGAPLIDSFVHQQWQDRLEDST